MPDGRLRHQAASDGGTAAVLKRASDAPRLVFLPLPRWRFFLLRLTRCWSRPSSRLCCRPASMRVCVARNMLPKQLHPRTPLCNRRSRSSRSSSASPACSGNDQTADRATTLNGPRQGSPLHRPPYATAQDARPPWESKPPNQCDRSARQQSSYRVYQAASSGKKERVRHGIRGVEQPVDYELEEFLTSGYW